MLSAARACKPPSNAQPEFRTLMGQAPLVLLVVDRMSYKEKKAASTKAHTDGFLMQGPW